MLIRSRGPIGATTASDRLTHKIMPYKDRQKRLEYHKRYNAKNYPAYYEKNKDVIRKKARKWISDNYDKYMKKNRAWKKANPERVKYHDKIRKQRRRINLKNKGSHTLEQWENLKNRFNHCCAICGMQEPFINQQYQHLTEDHIIPVSRGGSNNIENIQPLCQSCNSKKWNKI